MPAMAAQQTDEHLLGGRLTGAAGAQKAEDLATPNREVHAAHRRRGGLWVGKGQPFDPDDLGHQASGRVSLRDFHESLPY
jgi:hypothetical protein